MQNALVIPSASWSNVLNHFPDEKHGIEETP